MGLILLMDHMDIVLMGMLLVMKNMEKIKDMRVVKT
jgi:hypothetical protein